MRNRVFVAALSVYLCGLVSVVFGTTAVEEVRAAFWKEHTVVLEERGLPTASIKNLKRLYDLPVEELTLATMRNLRISEQKRKETLALFREVLAEQIKADLAREGNRRYVDLLKGYRGDVEVFLDAVWRDNAVTTLPLSLSVGGGAGNGRNAGGFSNVSFPSGGIGADLSFSTSSLGVSLGIGSGFQSCSSDLSRSHGQKKGRSRKEGKEGDVDEKSSQPPLSPNSLSSDRSSASSASSSASCNRGKSGSGVSPASSSSSSPSCSSSSYSSLNPSVSSCSSSSLSPSASSYSSSSLSPSPSSSSSSSSFALPRDNSSLLSKSSLQLRRRGSFGHSCMTETPCRSNAYHDTGVFASSSPSLARPVSPSQNFSRMNGYTPPLGDGGDVVSPSAVCPPDRPWSNVFRPASAPPADDLDGTLELRSLAARGEVSKERDQWRLEQQKLGQRLDQQKLEQQRLAQMLEQQRLDQERERLSHEQQRLNQDYQAQLQKQEQQKAKLQEERKELLKDLQVLLSVFSKPRSVCLDADSKVAISGTCKFLGVRKHLVAISDGGVVLSPDKVVEVCARLARSVSSADFKFFEEFEAKRMKDGDYDLVCRYLYKAFGDIMIGGMAEDIYIGRSRSIDRNGGCMIM